VGESEKSKNHENVTKESEGEKKKMKNPVGKRKEGGIKSGKDPGESAKLKGRGEKTVGKQAVRWDPKKRRRGGTGPG